MNLHKTLKKVYKAGYFRNFQLSKNNLRYTDGYGNVYVVNINGPGFPYFRIGHVEEWIEQAPTYESEYNDLGPVERARFVDHVKPEHTNNPDYVLRASLGYLGINN